MLILQIWIYWHFKSCGTPHRHTVHFYPCLFSQQDGQGQHIFLSKNHSTTLVEAKPLLSTLTFSLYTLLLVWSQHGILHCKQWTECWSTQEDLLTGYNSWPSNREQAWLCKGWNKDLIDCNKKGRLAWTQSKHNTIIKTFQNKMKPR